MLASIMGVSSEPLDPAVEAIAKRIDRRREGGSSGAALIAAQESSPAPVESDPERLVRKRERVRLGDTPIEHTAFAPDGGGGYSQSGGRLAFSRRGPWPPFAMI